LQGLHSIILFTLHISEEPTDEPEGNGICRICGDGDRRITTRRREKVKTKTNSGFTGDPII
jgi:hypothetical protein